MKANQLFEHLIEGHDLNPEQMQTVIHQCMNGQFSDLHIATFLSLMRMKGETTEELIAAAQVMRELALPIDLGDDLVDIVGTGGDGKNTFNVSTASSFVVAATGQRVAKHGNRSVSSRSGSADLLEQAGFILNLSDAQTKTCIQQCKLVFLFAPHYHPAMHHVRAARQQLGIRTLFNLLGPLINPACVKKQVVGVFSTKWLEPLARVLAHSGSERALVLSSADGMDEISISAPTYVFEYHEGTYTPWMINPEDYGIKHNSFEELIIDSPKKSLDIIESVLSGTKGPARDIVLLNAAAALYCANKERSFAQAIEEAQATIDSGSAASLFNELRILTQSLNSETHHD
jgi:anthranilate phosphoribosyltransferase